MTTTKVGRSPVRETSLGDELGQLGGGGVGIRTGANGRMTRGSSMDASKDGRGRGRMSITDQVWEAANSAPISNGGGGGGRGGGGGAQRTGRSKTEEDEEGGAIGEGTELLARGDAKSNSGQNGYLSTHKSNGLPTHTPGGLSGGGGSDGGGGAGTRTGRTPGEIALSMTQWSEF